MFRVLVLCSREPETIFQLLVLLLQVIDLLFLEFNCVIDGIINLVFSSLLLQLKLKVFDLLQLHFLYVVEHSISSLQCLILFLQIVDLFEDLK